MSKYNNNNNSNTYSNGNNNKWRTFQRKQSIETNEQLSQSHRLQTETTFELSSMC